MTQAIARDLLSSGQAAGPWVLDAQASTVRIASKTMWGAVTVKGGFSTVHGQASVSPDGQLTGTLTIDAESVNTKNKKRDEHLRSAEFFDVKTHPQIQIDVRSATFVTDDELRLACELTVRGVRKPMDLGARVVEATASAVTLLIETEIDRNHFELSWNKMGMMKGLTTVTINAVFTHAV